MTDAEMKFCINCGEETRAESRFCSECGVRQDAAVLESENKHCADCGEEISRLAEICPKCGVRQMDERTNVSNNATGKTSNLMDTPVDRPSDDPDAAEAFNLMVEYYRNHGVRAFIHLLLVVFSGGLWGFWFLSFWVGTMMGWKNTKKLRDLYYDK